MAREAGDSTSPGASPGEDKQSGIDRSVILILAGLVVGGIAFFYEWWRKLPK